MTRTQNSRVWPVLAVAGALVLLVSNEAWAWDGHSPRHHRSRWHDRSDWHARRGEGLTIVFSDVWSRPCPPPVQYATVIPAASHDIVVINILNANGSYTPVTLRRVGGVYVGPRGEQYLNVPTIEQLQLVYGLK